MSVPATPPPPRAPESGGAQPEAARIVANMARQMHELCARSGMLEASLAEALCDCRGLDRDTMTTLQKLDYLRQSLGDMARLSEVLAPALAWSRDPGALLEELRADLHMSESGGILDSAPPTGEHRRPVLPGEPELWD